MTKMIGPRLVEQILDSVDLPKLGKRDKALFINRLQQHLAQLAKKLHQLYGDHYDYFYYLQDLVIVLAKAFAKRKRDLKQLDSRRLAEPSWYRSEKMLGMALYVDLYAGDFNKLQVKIPYLKELGITYVHLMPLYKSPDGESDGGYAVSDYRKVDPKLGSEKEFAQLVDAFRQQDISVVLDFVFNHTSDEHIWAQKALKGEQEFEEFYYFFDDRQEVEDYNQTCREIFPTVRRGSFSYLPKVSKWVWTTFNNFQWDLNYSNPAVFNAITDEMLFLANIGCEALRLDALAFIWKEKWTQCESLPKAHTLIQAFNLCLQIVAPAVQFKSEAIVHPDEVAQYIDKDECQLSYNPLLMALMWESLATRETKLLTESLKKSFAISDQCSWVNYIRCHDDIGWTFDDSVAHQLGIKGYDHRRFLNQFYTGEFSGSFSQGVPFQHNPATGDCRVCGSLSSLAGLEKAMASGGQVQIEHSLRRIRLLNSINLSIGGIPLIYQGDEIGMLNDYSYLDDQFKREDSRWVNRPFVTADDIELATNGASPQAIIYQQLKQMIAIRQSSPVFGESRTEILDTFHPHLFSYARINDNGEKLLVIVNFSEKPQTIVASILDILQAKEHVDILNNQPFIKGDYIELAAYDTLWIRDANAVD